MYLILLSIKQGGIKYHFNVFSMTRPGIEPRSPRPLANTLSTRPIGCCTLLKNWPCVLPYPWWRAWVNTNILTSYKLKIMWMLPVLLCYLHSWHWEWYTCSVSVQAYKYPPWRTWHRVNCAPIEWIYLAWCQWHEKVA